MSLPASSSSSAGPLEPLAQTYYHGVISFLAVERTNLPVPLPPGGECAPTSSSSVAEALAASQLELSRPLPCRNTLPDSARRSRLGGLSRYLDRHAAAAAIDRGCLPDIGGSGYSGSIIFATGGALNTTVNAFYWDPSFASTAIALLHPPFLAVRR
jgi:hypothetical protein